MESSRRQKANKKLDGVGCGHCADPLAFGQDVAVCTACEAPHHAACWDGKQGCGKAGCTNAPLVQMAPAAQAGGQGPRPGYAACPHCSNHNREDAVVCGSCGLVCTPGGVYTGPQENAPGAVASLVWAIVGLFICGIILGPVAIAKSNEAKSLIRANPQLKGGGLATAALIIGILDIIGSLIFLAVRFGG